MKPPQVLGIVVLAVLATVAIEESRIAGIRQNAGKSESLVAAAAASGSGSSAPEPAAADAPVKTKSSDQPRPEAPKPESAVLTESLVGTARKMWENPAGKSMMSQGAKMAVAMMYSDFIDGLKLSKKESDYFKDLLGREVTDQQEIGMKMLGATPEEREKLSEELKKRGEETQNEINKFLNNDEDLKAFKAYKDKLPEHQQLDGIRAAMSGQGVPLEPDVEAKLVDAMYRARTEAKAPDLSGPGAIEEFAKGNITETFEKSWDAQQAALQQETAGILTPEQAKAFQDYQKQAKEMQLMGLKMAEQMMAPKKEEK